MAATGGQWRQVVAVTVLAALGTAGCDNGGAGDDSPEPAATATAPPTGNPTPRTDPAGTATDEEFPTDPQEYAERAVAAWAAPDLIRLAELTTVEVHQQIVDLPGPPDLSWRFIRCRVDPDPDPDSPGPTPGAGTSDCAFYNQDGDRLVLTIAHRQLGQARAATAMRFEATPYPDQALDYLAEFVAAWQDGNLGRMRNLAAPAALEVYLPIPPPPEVDYQAGKPTDTVLEVVVTFPAGEVTTGISTALLGEPQAIRSATLAPAG